MEEFDIDLNLNFQTELLSLEDLTTIAVASRIWQTSSMRQKLDKVLDKHYPEWKNGKCANLNTSCLNKLSPNVSKHVFQILNQLNDPTLPDCIKIKIEKKVLEMLEDIFNWIMYLIYDLKLDYEVTEIIYWTSYGHIDVDKIFRFFWVYRLCDKPVPWKRFDLNLNFLQCLACMFGQKKFILLHQTDFLDAIKSHYVPPEMESKSDIVFNIMRIVIYYVSFKYSYQDLIFSGGCFQSGSIIFDENRAPLNKSAVNMLNICKTLGFHRTFTRFWKHLDAVEKSQFLEKQSKNESSIQTPKFGRDYQFQIALFLLDRMDYDQKYDFLQNNYSTLIFMFLRKTRFENFCITLSKHFSSKLTLRDVKILFHYDIFTRKTKKPGNAEVEVLKGLLKRCFDLCTTESTLDYHYHVYSHVLKRLFKGFNFSILKSIINDENLAKHRWKIICIGEEKYKQLIVNNNFQLLNEFVDEILLSEEEKNKFKKDFNFLKEWIKNVQFDVVDNVLVWMHGAAYYKFKMELKKLCWDTIPINYDSIDKLLKWFFDAREPLINSCKDKLVLLKEFCRELIYNIWFRTDLKTPYDTASSDELSTKVLLLVFDSEREIRNFKATELVMDESFVALFCDNELQRNNWMPKEANFDTVDTFLINFCSLPATKIDQIKRLVSGNIHHYIVKYGVRPGMFNIVVPLLDWVYGEKEDNCYKIRNCFENPDAVVAYYSVRKKNK